MNVVDEILSEEPEKYICVVRLTTSVFKQGNRYVYQKSITPLKRKSTLGIDDVSGDIEYDLPELLNGSEQPDGLYELTATNFSRDYETGVIDDWDLILKPYEGDS